MLLPPATTTTPAPVLTINPLRPALKRRHGSSHAPFFHPAARRGRFTIAVLFRSRYIASACRTSLNRNTISRYVQPGLHS